jgi:hypothetical protein
MSYEVKGMLVFYEKGKVKIEARGRVVGWGTSAVVGGK